MKENIFFKMHEIIATGRYLDMIENSQKLNGVSKYTF